jgi:hypothetical protein
MSAPKRYDSIVIHAGQAGGPCLRRDFRVFRTNLLQGGSACITDRLLPYAVFIDPQGRIGLGFSETLVDPAPAPSWAPPSSGSRAAR